MLDKSERKISLQEWIDDDATETVKHETKKTRR